MITIMDYKPAPEGTKVLGLALGEYKTHVVGCSPEAFEKGLKAYREGALMQDAFPFLNADDREFLISGLTPAEWAEAFGEEE